MSDARAAAVHAIYNEWVDNPDLQDRVEEQGFSPELASFAGNCLGNIQRRYCHKADRGYIDDTTIGVIARTDLNFG